MSLDSATEYRSKVPLPTAITSNLAGINPTTS